MQISTAISTGEARRLALAAQGLAGRRQPSRRAAAAEGLREVMGRVGTIQLDAVSVLQRTQLIVPFTRLGAYDVEAFHRLSRPGGAWFEYWGHAASLLPLEWHPLFRWKMQRWREDRVDSPAVQARRRAWRAEHARYLASVLEEVRVRGPLAASQLADPRRREGTWWDRRSDGRRALELLFGDGVLAGWRNAAFERVYDLAERAIPAEVLALPTPSPEEAQRQLLALAGERLGVATLTDLADYFWISTVQARPRVAELVEQGRLLEVTVEGWNAPAYLSAGARAPEGAAGGGAVRGQARLVSPFDSLVWTRRRTERLFGFRYRIEIYVPAARRTHGYYVLPVLLGEELAGRVDLKSDRRARTLRVLGAWSESGSGARRAATALAEELSRLAGWLGLAGVEAPEQAVGDLLDPLRRALRASP